MFSYLSDRIIPIQPQIMKQEKQRIKKNKERRISGSLQVLSIHMSGSYADQSKRAYNICLFFKGHSGSATVEASLVLPLFLLAMLVIVDLCGCIRTRHAVYEGLQETAQYLAEYEYLYQMIGEGIHIDMGDGLPGEAVDIGTAYIKLKSYIDDSDLIEKYVSGGMAGLVITQAQYHSDDGFIYIDLYYKMKSNVVLFGDLEWDVHERVRQKAYVGYQNDTQTEDGIQYVYITENASVYHSRRGCYHISLSISQISHAELEAIRGSVTPCEICTKYHPDTGNIYVTDTGDRYHTSLNCSGLKRTVYRVKIEDYPYLPPCSHCS